MLKKEKEKEKRRKSNEPISKHHVQNTASRKLSL